jgi:alpha-acetolactate decarboxylase
MGQQELIDAMRDGSWYTATELAEMLERGRMGIIYKLNKMDGTGGIIIEKRPFIQCRGGHIKEYRLLFKKRKKK